MREHMGLCSFGNRSSDPHHNNEVKLNEMDRDWFVVILGIQKLMRRRSAAGKDRSCNLMREVGEYGAGASGSTR